MFLLKAFSTLDWIINSSSASGKASTVHILGQDCIFSVNMEEKTGHPPSVVKMIKSICCCTARTTDAGQC